MAERLIDGSLLPCVRKVAFVDLEASGLGSKSWPLEVGWALAEGEPSSMLIRPDSSWTDDARDDAAQRLHGLDRAILERDGRSPQEVCDAMNEALGDAEVYSDAADWDGFWLFRLFSAGGVRQSFTLRDFGRLMRPLAGAREEELLRRAARLAPRRHRAAADARHLQTLYRLACESCAPRLTR
jgi:hypothetical protein